MFLHFDHERHDYICIYIYIYDSGAIGDIFIFDNFPNNGVLLAISMCLLNRKWSRDFEIGRAHQHVFDKDMHWLIDLLAILEIQQIHYISYGSMIIRNDRRYMFGNNAIFILPTTNQTTIINYNAPRCRYHDFGQHIHTYIEWLRYPNAPTILSYFVCWDLRMI